MVEVDYDPDVIDYETLVSLFFEFHNETLRPYDQRVKSLIFYRTEKEESIANMVLEDTRKSLGEKTSVFAEIKSYDVFYLAEPEHQLRALKLEISLYEELLLMYGSEENLFNSVLASKLNGFVSGRGTMSQLEEVLQQSALSKISQRRLREIVEYPEKYYK